MPTNEEYEMKLMTILNCDTSVVGAVTEPLQHILSPSQYILMTCLCSVVRTLDKHRESLSYIEMEGLVPMTTFIMKNHWFAIPNRLLAMRTGIPLVSMSRKITELVKLGLIETTSFHTADGNQRVIRINAPLLHDIMQTWRSAIGVGDSMTLCLTKAWGFGGLEVWEKAIQIIQAKFKGVSYGS